MVDAFVYCAALLCSDCGEAARHDITNAGLAPADPDNESSYDSDQFPKGPYPDGGGEADAPQHCDHCGTFLDNPLTEDGSIYVKAQWREFVNEGLGAADVLRTWRDGYPCEWAEFAQEMESEEEAGTLCNFALAHFSELADR